MLKVQQHTNTHPNFFDKIIRKYKTRSSIVNFQKKILLRAKTKSIGPVEYLNMYILGSREGNAGLLRKTESGDWNSPGFNNEGHRYNEFCDRLYGLTQLQLSEIYIKIGTTIDEIKHKEEALDQLLQKTPTQPNEVHINIRKSGEDELTDDQIRSRRGSELTKQNAPYYAKIKKIEEEIEMAYVKLNQWHNHVVEINNSTRLICERLKYHTEQRRGVYWKAVLRKHPLKEIIPVIPAPLSNSEAELTYIAQNKNLENEAVDMLARRARLVLSQESENKFLNINEVA